MRINLLPLDYRPQPLLESKRILLITVASFLVCCSLFGTLYFYIQKSMTESNINNLTQQLNSLQSEKIKIENSEKRFTEIKKRLDEVDSIQKSYPPFILYLNKLANSLAPELWLKSIDFSSGSIQINGDSLSFSMVGDMLRNLSKQQFQSVRLTKVTEGNAESLKFYEFSLEISTQEGGLEYAKK